MDVIVDSDASPAEGAPNHLFKRSANSAALIENLNDFEVARARSNAALGVSASLSRIYYCETHLPSWFARGGEIDCGA